MISRYLKIEMYKNEVVNDEYENDFIAFSDFFTPNHYNYNGIKNNKVKLK